jgi:hypothetical protein
MNAKKTSPQPSLAKKGDKRFSFLLLGTRVGNEGGLSVHTFIQKRLLRPAYTRLGHYLLLSAC